MLISVAKRIQSAIRAQDTIARMGGDEFALLVPGLNQVQRAAQIAEVIIDSISQVIPVDDEPIIVGASVGIALYPDHGSTAQELLTNADLALYHAKDEGKLCHRFYQTELREATSSKRAYQSEFKRALEHREFELFYQPQIRLSDRAVVGAEALLRWNHPLHGLLSPQRIFTCA